LKARFKNHLIEDFGLKIEKQNFGFAYEGNSVNLGYHKRRRSGKKGKDCTLFLFNDLLVETSTPKKGIYSQHLHLPLSDFTARPVSEGKFTFSNVIEIKVMFEEEEHTLHYSFQSKEEKDTFIDSFLKNSTPSAPPSNRLSQVMTHSNPNMLTQLSASTPISSPNTNSSTSDGKLKVLGLKSSQQPLISPRTIASLLTAVVSKRRSLTNPISPRSDLIGDGNSAEENVGSVEPELPLASVTPLKPLAKFNQSGQLPTVQLLSPEGQSSPLGHR